MKQPLSLKQLIDADYVQAPAKLLAVYKGRQIEAVLLPDGTVNYSGKIYRSLSVAAGKAKVDAGAEPAPGLPYRHVNGWTFWKYVHNGCLTSLARIKQRVSDGTSSST